MADRLQQPCPVITRTAGFDSDHGRCKLLEERHHLLAPKLLAQNRRLSGIHPMKLENLLLRVHPNSANLVHGRPPLSEICNDLILARSMPSGAVHTNRFPRRMSGAASGSSQAGAAPAGAALPAVTCG